MFVRRHEVITFKDPQTLGWVQKLLNIEFKDWNRKCFQALVKLYNTKLNQINDTVADKFIKSIK